jgi:tetratricopeptide (TPR) repeat protein
LAAQKSRPNDPLPWNDCGNSYFNSGDLEQAKYCYLEAMKLSELYGPKLGSIYNNIAWCLLSKEHPDDFEAEKYLSKSFDLLGIEASHLDLPDYLKIDGLNAVAKRTLIQGTALYGLVHYIRGSYDQASKFLTYSVSVAEHYSLDEPYPYLYLGNVYFKTGRFQDAERSYAQAKKFGKQYAEACDSYGVALSKNDKAQDALQEFQTAVRLKPSLVPSVLHLTRTQAYLDSGGKSVSESPKFIAYWSKSKKRGMTALALIGIAAILAATSVVIGDHVSDVRSVSNLGNANLTTTTSITETRSVSATSMILVGIIVFVLLFPDLRSTKVSRLELNLQGETAGYHNRLHAETNSSLEIFLR